MKQIDGVFLGDVPYGIALQYMEELSNQIKSGGDEAIFLLQHPKVITLGRNADEENLLLSIEEYRERNIEVFKIKRGGDVTFHGPGQLVGYPIVKVGRKVTTHVNQMFDSLREILSLQGISSIYESSNPGLWVENRKIAAIGVEIRDGISRHGFSLNVKSGFNGFELIVPCGLQERGVVFISDLADVFPMGHIAEDFAYRFSSKSNRKLNWLSKSEFFEKRDLTRW
jgi:lipoyl(octanoyl) transferase